MDIGSVTSGQGMATKSNTQVTMKILDTSGLNVRNVTGGEEQAQQAQTQVGGINMEDPNPLKINLLA